jgi:hypothetical protein
MAYTSLSVKYFKYFFACKHSSLLIVILLIYFVFIPVLFACRYTVSEIGYADFGVDAYHLYLFKDDYVTKQQTVTFKRITQAALFDANIKPEVIDIKAEQDSSVLHYYQNRKNINAPHVAFVTPDDKVKYFCLSQDSVSYKESVWLLTEKIVTSPIRERILDQIVRCYAVVLLVEGSDVTENQKALTSVRAAVDEISRTMSAMPKPIEHPPLLIILKKEQIREEEILLWSIGWHEEISQEPAVAIFYGRGRSMGRLLQGELLRENVIRNLLSFIGADCECGLDRSWILGAMIPLRWNTTRQAEVAKVHNFDAENPLVKAEMSQILALAPSNVSKRGKSDLYGYSEKEIRLVMNQSATGKQVQESEISSLFGRSWLWLVITFVLLTVTGIMIFIRRR